MSSHKYASLGDDAPEVVPNQDAPELVKSDRDAQSFPEARTSAEGPEALHVAAYEKQAYEYYGSKQDNAAPTYSSWSAVAGSNGAKLDEEAITKTEQSRTRDRRRPICGMRRSVFIAVIVILILVIIGAVLGGVLGSLLSGKSSTAGAIKATSMTGLAATVQDGTLYQYFQSPDGKVAENTYANNEWSLKPGGNAQGAIVTTEAATGSPMAAISYPYNGEKYRQIFYLNSAGMVRTTNRTSTGSWSPPVSVSTVAAEPGSIALAACWNDHYLDGLRIYYASQYGWIQEIGGYFNGSKWTTYQGFSHSDPHSGVGCSIQNEPNNEYMNVYFRDPRNSTVAQWFWNYVPSANNGWFLGAVSGRSHVITPGSDIAVCNDNVQTEYVFYQAPNNVIMLGINDPTQTVYETFTQRQAATTKAKLAAAYVEGGATVIFQNSSSSSTMWASDVSRDGVEIFNMPVA